MRNGLIVSSESRPDVWLQTVSKYSPLRQIGTAVADTGKPPGPRAWLLGLVAEIFVSSDVENRLPATTSP